MYRTMILVVAVALFTACNSETKKTTTDDEIRAVTLEELSTSATDLQNSMVEVTGMVDHVCKHGGQKMFLSNKTGDTRLLIRVSQSIPEFDVALEGSNVKVTGKLVATMIEEEDDHHEEEHDAKASDGEKSDEDCETDTVVEEGTDACTANITYHIEAVSYSEVIDE